MREFPVDWACFRILPFLDELDLSLEDREFVYQMWLAATYAPVDRQRKLNEKKS